MRLDIYVYSALLAAGLGAAYWASLPVPDGSEDKVSVLTLDPKAVTEVSYKTPLVDLVAVKRPSDGRFWVTFSHTEPPVENPHAPKDPKAPPPVAKTTTEHFLASEKMDELLKNLNPLFADRVLEQVDDKQLTDYGLKDAKDTWTVKSSGSKDFTLILGKRSYGSRSRFAQQPEAKAKVLIIDGDDLESLERANLRLYDRRLTTANLAETTKAEVQVGAKNKTLYHTLRGKDGELAWTDDEQATKTNQMLDGFMDKVGKLHLAEYASAEDEATLKPVVPFLVVSLTKDGKALDRLEFKKVGGDKPVYWVTSDSLQTYAKLVGNRVEPLEKDAAAVVSEAPAKKG